MPTPRRRPLRPPSPARALSAGCAVAAMLLLPAEADAQSPRLKSVGPTGIRRGVPTEVVVSGSNLAGRPRLIAPFDVEVAEVSAADGSNWRVRLAPSLDTPVGLYPIRVQTSGGVSNAVVVAVDQFPHVVEAEENGAFASAQRIETPTIVEGQVAGADVDHFRFRGRKGDRIVVDARCARIGSAVDPSIRLSTASRRFVASADDSPGLSTDARLTAVLPVDGDYVVEIADARYGATGPQTHYQLAVGAIPTAGACFPLGGRRGERVDLQLVGGTLGDAPRVAPVALPLVSPGSAERDRFRPRVTEASLGLADPLPIGGWSLDVEGLPPIALGRYPEHLEPVDPAIPPTRWESPSTLNGRISRPREVDTHLVAVEPGKKYRVVVEAASLGSSLDASVQVKGKGGNVIAQADDSELPAPVRPKPVPNDPNKNKLLSPDPVASFTAPGGESEVSIVVRDVAGHGGPDFSYRVTVEPAPPGFSILVGGADHVNVPRGGTVALTVDVDRLDFAGPIRLKAVDLPPGITGRDGLAAEGQSGGVLTLSAAPDASFDAADLRVEGVADGPTGPIRSEAGHVEVEARIGEFASNYVTRGSLLVAPSSPAPVALEGPSEPVEVVAAYAGTVPIRATRSAEGQDVALAFGAVGLPPNMAVAADPKLEPKALAANLVINTNPDTSIGTFVVALNAKGKVGDRERTFFVPATTLRVVRAAELAPESGRVGVAAGASAELRGKVVRRGPFKDPVTVKLEGLPGGVKAEPLVVPADSTDFALKVVADASATPGETSTKLTIAYKLGPKDYAVPPIPIQLGVSPAPKTPMEEPKTP